MSYNHVVSLESLQDDKYTFIQTDYDLASVLELVGLPEEYIEDITGAVILLEDGDYIAVWLTESARPYDLHSHYHPLPFYLTEDMKGPYLPEYWQESNPEYN